MSTIADGLRSSWWIAAVLGVALAAPSASAGTDRDEEQWEAVRDEYFGDREIRLDESGDVVALDVPFRAQDPALAPMTIEDRTGAERRITDLWLVVDKNPLPMAAHFRYGPEAADASLTSRIRIQTYSYVRAIAETDDGELHMAREHVRASGGCAAPISGDDGNPNLGQMRFSTDASGSPGVEGHLRIRHPQVTGLQMNQVTRLYPRPHYVDRMEITRGGETVVDADLTFTFSENPSFRFRFAAEGKEPDAAMRVRVRDTEEQWFEEEFSLDTSTLLSGSESR